MATPIQERRRVSRLRLLLLLVIVGLGGFFGGPWAIQATSDYVDSLRTEPTITWFAPYVDVTLTPVTHFEETFERPSHDVVLGFVVADTENVCAPSWGTYYDLEGAARALDLDRRIVKLRERGGNAIVSFGGAINNELATVCKDVDRLAAAYAQVIDHYGLDAVDFDIEGPAVGDTESNVRRAEAIKIIQQERPHLQVWFTLPVAPHGLSADAVALVDGLLAAGIDLSGINVMTMNYAESRGAGVSMHAANLSALDMTRAQLTSAYARADIYLTDADIWRRIGATPMIGQNDVPNDVFTTGDAHALVEYAHAQQIGRLSFWSVNRDVACGVGDDGVRVSNTCSGVRQDALEFADIFAANATKRTSAATQVQAEALETVSPFDTGATSDELRAETLSFDDPETIPYPLWRPAKAYESGDKVVWQGRVYQAKWWSDGDRPDAPVQNPWDTPWRYLGPVLESDRQAALIAPDSTEGRPNWSTETIFIEGDEVEHAGQVFRARWWTQGQEPEEDPDQEYDHPWEYLGEINCGGVRCEDIGTEVTLSVDYGGLVGVSMEVRASDGVPDSAGRVIQAHVGQGGKKSYEVFPGVYDLVFRAGSLDITIDDVDCESGPCSAGEITDTLWVNYEGLSDVLLEIRQANGVPQAAGALVTVHEGQGGNKTYDVLKGTYDLVFKKGAAEYVVDAVECLGSGCSAGDVVTTLAVDFGGLAEVRVEARRDDGVPGTAGALVFTADGQSGTKSYDTLRGRYDIVFQKGAATLVVDSLDGTGNRVDIENIAAELTINYGLEESPIEIRTSDGSAGTAGGLVDALLGQTGARVHSVLLGKYDIVVKSEVSEESTQPGPVRIYDQIDCSDGACGLDLEGLEVPDQCGGDTWQTFYSGVTGDRQMFSHRLACTLFFVQEPRFQPSHMSDPEPFSSLEGSSGDFIISPGRGMAQHSLLLGSSPGGGDIVSWDNLLWKTFELRNLPTDGRTIYVVLRSSDSSESNVFYQRFTYTSAGS